MPAEIERKFLLTPSGKVLSAPAPAQIQQGYLAIDDHNEVRVRIINGKGFITAKSDWSGSTRSEVETPISLESASEFMALCGSRVIRKNRYLRPCGRHLWEVDEFLGPLEGLYLAEIELVSETEEFKMPSWVSAEVTADKRFSNKNLYQYRFDNNTSDLVERLA